MAQIFHIRIPLFATLMLMDKGRPVIGAINQPILKQMIIGDCDTTTLNGKPVFGRNACPLSEATLLRILSVKHCGKTRLIGRAHRGPLFTVRGAMRAATFFSAWALSISCVIL